MGNENEFEFLDQTYQAKEVDLSSGCNGCEIWTISNGCLANTLTEEIFPPCDQGYRADGRNVIFVEKHP